MNGIQAFLELLHNHGIRHVFGNPGTTELPLNDAIASDDRFRYIFGVHEIPVMAMADGYSQAGGDPAVVNLHTACGLGNAMGMLYNAFVAGTPLIVTAGQQDARLRFNDPVLAGDLVGPAKPWTKWAYEVTRVGDLPNAFRRAYQIATTPPTGPVFLSLPLDVQLADAAGLNLARSDRMDTQVRPSENSLRFAEQLLSGAKNPVILAGSRAYWAADEIARLASTLGAPVFAECATSHNRLPIPPTNPLYQGPLPIWSPDVRETLAPFDVALVVGMNLLRLYIYREPDNPIPDHLRIIHLDNDPNEIGKNYPVEVAMWGDPWEGVRALNWAAFTSAGSHSRRETLAAAHQQRVAELRRKAAEERDIRPMTPTAMMTAIADAVPDDIVVVDEAATTHQHILERLGAIRSADHYFAHRGWALGWGIGAAVGVKLAWPRVPVLALIGDGAALYGIQSLWSAAHHRVPLVVVICNNANYRILQNCGKMMGLDRVADGTGPGLAPVDPAPDFVGLARAFGVEACRVADPEELSARIRDGFMNPRPLLIDATVGV